MNFFTNLFDRTKKLIAKEDPADDLITLTMEMNDELAASLEDTSDRYMEGNVANTILYSYALFKDVMEHDENGYDIVYRNRETGEIKELDCPQ